MKKLLITITCFILLVFSNQAQVIVSDTLNVKSMTIEQIKNLNQNQLLNLSLEELMLLVSRLKVSSIEELYRIILTPEVYTASKFSESSFEAPLNVTVVTAEQIHRSGITSIAEAMRLVPGMIVREKSNGNFDVHIRGNDNLPPGKLLFDAENTNTLVMVDGRPVYSHFQGGTLWESLPIELEELEKIEVVQGPSSAMYGPNAVSGVINLITIDPCQDQSIRVHATGNSLIGGRASASASAGNNKLAFRLSGGLEKRRRTTDNYYSLVKYKYFPSDSLPGLVQNSNKRYPHPNIAQQRYTLNGILSYTPDSTAAFVLSVGTQQSNAQTIYLDINNLSMSNRESQTHYFDLQSKFQHFITRLSYSFGTQNNALGYDGYKFEVSQMNATTEYRFATKKATLQPGISFNMTEYDDRKFVRKGAPSLFGTLSRISTLAAFVRGEYRPTKKLRLVAALRAEQHNKPARPYFSFQFNTVYNASNNTVFRLGYGRANQGPFIYDYYVNIKGFTLTNQGYYVISDHEKNDGLKLLTMDNTEFGIRHRFNSNIYAEGTLFYSHVRNLSEILLISPEGTPPISRKDNIPLHSHQMGISVTLNTIFSKQFQANVFGTTQMTMLKHMDVLFNYDYTHTGHTLYYQDDFHHQSTPAIFGGAYLNYSPAPKWNINTSLYYYSKQTFFTIDGFTHIPSKAIMNLRGAWQWKKGHEIYLNLHDIFGQSAIEFPFADKTSPQFELGIHLNFNKK